MRTGFRFNGVIVRPEQAYKAKYKCSVFFSEGLYVLEMQNERRETSCTYNVLSLDWIMWLWKWSWMKRYNIHTDGCKEGGQERCVEFLAYKFVADEKHGEVVV